MPLTLFPWHEAAGVLALRLTPQVDQFQLPCTLRSEREKRRATNAKSRLMSLPAELRTLIYKCILIEPKKWDKRHLPSCERYAAPEVFEIPPFRCYEPVAAGSQGLRHHKSRQKGDDSHHACVRRQGLGLLLASKQIYHEAVNIIFENNTFCFDSAKNFVQTHHVLSQATRSLIRSISIIEFMSGLDLIYSGSDLSEWRAAMLGIMASMSGLKEVELPARCFRFDFDGDLMKLRKLERITMVLTAEDNLRLPSRQEACRVYMAMSRQVPVPLCSDERHWERPRCMHCKDFFRALTDEASVFLTALAKDGLSWDYRVAQKLKAKPVSHLASDAPYKTHVKLEVCGKTEVRVWGLPRQTKLEAEKQAKEEQEAEWKWKKDEALLQKGIRAAKQRVSVKYVCDEDGEEREVGKGPSARSQRHLKEESKKDSKTMLEQRENRRVNVAEKEKVSKKQERQVKAKAKAEAVEEARLNRKAESKRAGRR